MKRLPLLSLLAAALVLSLVSFAQSGGSFSLVKSTIDGGGGFSAGGQFVLTGTIGQPDASAQTSKGGQFSVAGGFWANAEIGEVIFRNSFESQ